MDSEMVKGLVMVMGLARMMVISRLKVRGLEMVMVRLTGMDSEMVKGLEKARAR